MSRTPLNAFCALTMGQSPDSESYNIEHNGFPFYQGNADFGRIHPMVRVWCSAPKKLAKAGDILISVRAPIGALNIADCDCCIGRGLAAITPDATCADTMFLFYALYASAAELQRRGTGSTFKAISKNALSNLLLPSYCLKEQKEISAVLQQVDHLISLRQRQAEKLDELVKARFVEMFGDPVRNTKLFPQHELKEYIQFLTSGSRGWAKFFSDDGELFITIKNVKNGHINLSDIQHVMPPDNAEAKRTKVQAGDLLISITADLGRTGVVSDNLAQRGAYINQHLTCIRLKKDEVLPQYVSAFLESAAGKRQFSAKNQSAVKAGLNFEAIKSLRLFMPPLELQREYIAFVNEVDREKERIQRSAALLETLKRSLMQQYFG